MLVNNALGSMQDVSVVGRCRDGRQALDSIRAEQPDLVTLDVEMPVMDGLATLREIRRLAQTEECFRKVRVVLLSSLTKSGTDITIQGLNEGALECIPKPAEGDVDKNQDILRSHLLRAVETVRAQLESSLASQPRKPQPVAKPVAQPVVPQSVDAKPMARPRLIGVKPQAILIGVSTGGPAALSTMLPELTRKTNLPILVVQHMPPGFTKSLAESLAKKCRHKVIEAAEGDAVIDGTVYIAPGGKHMAVSGVVEGQRKITLSDAPPENGCRPAVDFMFRSAATAYGNKLLAVILTGMGSDGTLGVRPLYALGVRVIVQDKETSVVWGMPGSAVEAGVVDEVLPLMQIPDAAVKALG